VSRTDAAKKKTLESLFRAKGHGCDRNRQPGTQSRKQVVMLLELILPKSRSTPILARSRFVRLVAANDSGG